MLRLGFVGLGVMGAPMAGHLARAGFPLTVWNRTGAKAGPLAELGAAVAEDLPSLGSASDLVFLCVNRSEDVRECLEGLRPSLASGSLVVDHSTIAPSAAREFGAWLAEAGIRFMDAPITGGSMGARDGTLTIFCGGEPDDFSRTGPVIEHYAKRAELVGPLGAGQTMKLANQIAVGGALAGLCESLAFAAKAGLDLKQTREMLAAGAAGSWAFENYGPKVLARDWSPGFSIKNQRKDFAYLTEEARSLDAAIPTTLVVDEWLAKLQRAGREEQTTAALFDAFVEAGFDE